MNIITNRAKIPRDALLMLIFKDRPGGIIEVNELLSKNGMEMLRTSGVQEYVIVDVLSLDLNFIP